MKGALRIPFFVGILAVVAQNSPQVCINDGCLIGITETTRLNRTFNSFLGVPYAKPPVGELRFKPPQPPNPWATLNATEDGNICPQSIFFRMDENDTGGEDCLYLNVHTPQLNNSTKLLPVIVWLHSSGFMFWSGTRRFFGGNYFLDRDVVVVAPNYRLNVFGFLSTEDEECPGNWGLKDQTFVLKWVQKNIAKFGGDPDKVTVQGQSAGAMSAHYHMLSPLSKGLFHRVIAESGTALSHFASSCVPGDARNHAMLLGAHLDCPRDNSSVLVKCLRGKTTDELMDADARFTVWNKDPWIPYRPTVEPEHLGAFLLATPEELLRRGHFTDVPLIIGIAEKEGTILSSEYVSNQALLDDMEANLNTSFPAIMSYTHASSEKKTIITRKIKDFYFGDSHFTTDKVVAFTDMLGDRGFNYAFAKTLKLQKSQKNPIFAYIFESRDNITFANFLGYATRDYDGTAHMDELIYLFPMARTFFNGYVHNAEGNARIERMLDLWTNFATNGTPTHTGYDIEWLPVTENVEYLAIRGANDLPMINTPFFPERMAFWENLDLETNVCQLANQNVSTNVI